MVFTELIFLCFFLPLSVGLYYLLGRTAMMKNLILIIVSLFFFTFGDIHHIGLLLVFILFNYLVCLGIEMKRSKELVALGVVFNVGVLVYYKYMNFFLENYNILFGKNTALLEILVPLGISFIVFQAITMLVDVYRGDTDAGSVVDAGLFLVFFPKLVSGPIVRYKDFKPQIGKREHSIDLFYKGAERFIVGLVKKLLVADILGGVADQIFMGYDGAIDAPTAWLGALCYMLQIYYDFSGYSDCAVGLSSMFGFRLKENFNFPYLSRSITEFWRRWHISLGEWFREYIYFPLGGSRRGNAYINVAIVFLITGIWHGASWTFVLWGGMHGTVRLMEKRVMDTDWYKKIHPAFKWIFTMAVVYFGWIFFKSESLVAAAKYIGIMFGFVTPGNVELSFLYFVDLRTVFTLLVALAGAGLIGKQFQERVWNGKLENSPLTAGIKMGILSLMLVISIIYIVNSTYSPYIYFQF